MIKGIGLDIIEIARIKQLAERNGRFIARILTENEREIYEGFSSVNRKYEFLAGRFAVKEAFSKAVGKGIGKLSFQHIEVIPNEEGAPIVQVEGYEADQVFVSISHSEHYAVAQIIITDG